MQPNKKKQVSVKDKLDDNTLDLSLMELTEVPVKEMAPLTRASIVDLSNNKLVSLPPNFATSLTFIVKLDLSRNQLRELPENFGQLRNLRHLDLFSNQLERVPISFHQLRQLKWLDLKNNPLVPSLADAAGDCLDTKGCQAAARNVVKLMEMAKVELDKQLEKKLQLEKGKEEKRKEREAQEQERLRQQKKMEKEKRKAELRAQHMQKTNGKPEAQNEEGKTESKISTKESSERKSAKTTTSQGSSFCGNLFRCLFYVLLSTAVLAGAIVALHWEGAYTAENVKPAALRALKTVEAYTAIITEKTGPLQKRWEELSKFLTENTRETVKTVLKRSQHYAAVGWNQFLELWNHYSAIIRKEAPVYYKVALDKVNQISDKLFGDEAAHKGK